MSLTDINFVAIDFETATSKLTACQFGAVVVRNGEIVKKESILIQPPENKYSINNTKVHGISSQDTINAPNFSECWDRIKPYFEHQVVVFHGSSNDFDLLVLGAELQRYGLDCLDSIAEVNTFYRFNDKRFRSRSLEYLCACYGIEMEKAHDALNDAHACAQLFIKYLLGYEPNYNMNYEPAPKVVLQTAKDLDFNDFERRKMAKDTLVQDLDCVEIRDTIFYDKKVVISGVFERYPIRDALGQELKLLGADINTSISSKTDIFIVGQKSGPKKMEKVEGLSKSGCPIIIIEENRLYNILDKIYDGKKRNS